MAQNTKLAGYNAGATPLTGVNPVHTIQFGVCITGRKSTDTPETVETKVVKDAESLSISVDGTIEEWNPMDQAGWTRRLTTGKSLGMTMGGKRNYGDEGNDYIASLALKTGQECNTWVSIIFPNLDQLLIPAEQVIILVSANAHIFSDVELADIKTFRKEMLTFFKEQHSDIINTIESTKDLTDETKEAIIEAAKEFKNK